MESAWIYFAFDPAISFAEAGAFKPHWKTYAKAEQLAGFDRSSISSSPTHGFDRIGAKACPCAWPASTVASLRWGKPHISRT